MCAAASAKEPNVMKKSSSLDILSPWSPPPVFCLLVSVVLFSEEGGAFVRREQGRPHKAGGGVGGGGCHNKQKQRSNPPKSNQEPLIRALNSDWVPWERLIQSGRRQPRMGLGQFRRFFFVVVIVVVVVVCFPLSFCSHLWTQLYQLKDDPIQRPSLSFYSPLVFGRTHLWASIHAILSVDEQSVPFTPLTLHEQCARAPRCFPFSNGIRRDASTKHCNTR